MPSIFFDGRQQFVPGAYTKTEVRSSLPGPLPALHVAVLLGQGPVGKPYSVAASALDVEGDQVPWEYCGTATKVARENGYESELAIGATYGWRHGLPGAYVVNLAPLTRPSIELDAAASLAQVDVYSKAYGAPANALQLSYVASTDILTIVPVKAFAMLSANTSISDTRVYLSGSHGWLSENAKVYIADNTTTTPVLVTVSDSGVEIDSNGQRLYWVELSAGLAAAYTTADYAFVYQMDTSNTITGTGLGTPQAVIDFINNDAAASQLLSAERNATYDGSDLVDLTIDSLGWSTNSTAGTSPPMTNTQLQAFVSNMNAGDWDKFVEAEQVIPHSYLLLSGDSTLQGTLRDYAIAERTRNYPIAATAGVSWGDTVIGAGDSTDPTFRSGALNSQDFCLVAGGLDRRAAYLTLAPAVFARRVAGGPGHNLTNDTFIYEELEKLWDEIDSGELTALLKAGVVSYKLSVGQSIQYAVSQGLSTLQANGGAIWNEVDSTTYSLMQRDLADFANIVIKRDMESLQVGANEVTATTVGAVLFRRAARSLLKQGFITDFAIESITLNDAGSGYDVVWNVRLPTTADFITITTIILLGD
mgnify:CR=1 FL=1|jgi:hypothetical protein